MTEINYEENKIISNRNNNCSSVRAHACKFVYARECACLCVSVGKMLALQACGPEFNPPEHKFKERPDVVVCTYNSRAGEVEIGRYLKLTCQPA